MTFTWFGFTSIYEYERGLVFTLGKFSGIRGPGLTFVVPFLQRIEKMDMRIKTVDIPKQEVMTRDNVPVAIDAVVYFRVDKPDVAYLEIQDFVFAVAKYAQTALRDVAGNADLDFVLTERDKIADRIREIMDKETADWGVDVTAIKLQNMELPADMKRAMARQAEAEREKRATIIMSSGELTASTKLAEAAKKLSATKGALHLRTLQTLSDVSSDPSETVVYLVPMEMLRALEGFVKKEGGV